MIDDVYLSDDTVHFTLPIYITVNSNRIHLKAFPGVDGSDYINASYVDVSITS